MLYFYKSTNPCICSPTPEQPECPDDCNCLKLCSIAVNALSDDAVGPCAATGTLDISDEEVYGHDLCACGADPVVWSIEEYDKDIFISASITSAGVLSWTTQGAEVAGEYGCVVVKVCCENLSAYLIVTIGVKDLCNPCPPACAGICEECDPCTGLCADGNVETSIKGTNTSGNSNISAQ